MKVRLPSRRALLWGGLAALFTLACVGAGALVGYAVGRASSGRGGWARAVRIDSGARARLLRTFRAPAPWTGLLVSGPDGRRDVAWGLRVGGVRWVVLGHLYGADGKDLTKIALDLLESGPLGVGAPPPFPAINPPASPSPGDTTRGTVSSGGLSFGDMLSGSPAPSSASRSSAAIVSGPSLTPSEVYRGVVAAAAVRAFGRASARRVLYVLADPDCPYCHELYDALRAERGEIDRLGLAVAWVPVAILHPGSLGRAAAILRGGAAALALDERRFDPLAERGGVPPLADRRLERAVMGATLLLLHDGHPPATPTLVWRAGGAVHIEAGLPPDIGRLLRAIGR